MQEKKTIRVGILGFGDRGVSLVAPSMNCGLHVQLTTIIDPNVPLAKHFLGDCVRNEAISADEAARVTMVKDISEVSPGQLDVLFLTASERVRTRVFEQAVQTGAHLYVEKGLSNDLEGARTVVRAMKHKRPDQVVMMGFNFRYWPLSLEAKRLIDEGRVGRVLMVHYIEMLRQRHGSAFFARFHRDVANSGGMLVTKSCHDFDLMGHLIGSRPARVFNSQARLMFGLGGPDARENCHTCDRREDCDFSIMKRGTRADKRRYTHLYTDPDCVTGDGYTRDCCVWKAGSDLCDTSMVQFEYQSGAMGNYTQVLYAPIGNRIVNIFGDRGSLFFNEHEEQLVLKDLWNRNTYSISPTPLPGGHGGSDTNIVNAFFDAIREGEQPPCQVEDGVWSLCSAMAAYESASRESWVEVPPLVESVMKAGRPCAEARTRP